MVHHLSRDRVGSATRVRLERGRPRGARPQWRFTVEKVPGGSRLRYHVRLGPGRSGLTPAIEAMPDKEARIVAGRQREHQQNMQRVIEGIKEKAETQAAVERSDPSGFPR